MKHIISVFLLLFPLFGFCINPNSYVAFQSKEKSFCVATKSKMASILVSKEDEQAVIRATNDLQSDVERVTGRKPNILNELSKQNELIIVGTLGKNQWIDALVAQKKIDVKNLQGKWETFVIQTIENPFPNVKKALVIVGSDRRGAIYGIYDLSKQIGVSPWYFWADVPVPKHDEIYVLNGRYSEGSPKVKYRGIFINDEAPALSGWSKEKFGGFNHKFYGNVFELLLRLKANYIWPAMWGSAFYADDAENIKTADEYGIVIGTSHHEPLMRAHDEWRREKGGVWNYETNPTKLQAFWREGMKRATNEKIVSVGMRGDGDEPMSRETATALLEKIVKDQRNIISEVTGKPASETPQLWALYKEVQDYYDKGMTVPEDVTLLLCDDNWGNLRKLPKPDAKARKGGYGIYYHFDYVGGPRNYKWLNTNPLPRIWEQMHLAWEHNVKDIWIVNVGDIKPMEFPISFFLDYAWNPEKIQENDLQQYSEQWTSKQFGNQYAKEIAFLLNQYSKFNGRRKPELLDANTYNLKTGEWKTVVADYNNLLQKAEGIKKYLSPVYQDAYFQLVLHPIKACANLNEMYYNVALNKEAFENKWKETNTYADKVKELFAKDSVITREYHQLNNGKWNHLMSQTHIGYTYWQQPEKQKMPVVKYLDEAAIIEKKEIAIQPVKRAEIPNNTKGNAFYQDEQNGLGIEANHFTKAINSNGIQWKILPDHGRTGSAITTFPVTAKEQKPEGNAPHLEYEIYTFSEGDVTIQAYFSPSLNFYGTENGLQYAISIDDEQPQIISLNKEDKTSDKGIWNKWAAENIIIKTSKHTLAGKGKHTVKYWMVTTGVVLQKLDLNFGRQEQNYLGSAETLNTSK
ncbi:glycosyl hydrolase 115 family protein [Arcicella sp. DC2W]|uniref:Glycosyl hydrolase 115 family protein n=1 Tax=Arcicella gelida TaxID=2984195 RepID=A0ABU5S4A0_9BACT|nr:glycosyl hydrolase 115 family protein [Arcicella sp. DC2W]MEA5403276.1 glycosyl hydrolase 115 family protein [Arcicella sp. DC2W]